MMDDEMQVEPEVLFGEGVDASKQGSVYNLRGEDGRCKWR